MTHKKKLFDKLDLNPIYKGEVDNCVRNGVGQAIYLNTANIYSYKGNWVDGKKHKEGTFEIKGISTYTGEFINGQIEGFGHRRWDDGKEYVGNWVEGEMNGIGKWTSSIGEEVYEGNFMNNKRSGQGTLTIRKDDGVHLYRGGFCNNKFHGKGIYILENSFSLDGYFDMDIAYGFSSVQWCQLSEYEGTMKSGYFSGNGYFRCHDDSYEYIGQFENGLISEGYSIEVKPSLDRSAILSAEQPAGAVEKGKKAPPAQKKKGEVEVAFAGELTPGSCLGCVDLHLKLAEKIEKSETPCKELRRRMLMSIRSEATSEVFPLWLKAASLEDLLTAPDRFSSSKLMFYRGVDLKSGSSLQADLSYFARRISSEPVNVPPNVSSQDWAGLTSVQKLTGGASLTCRYPLLDDGINKSSEKFSVLLDFSLSVEQIDLIAPDALDAKNITDVRSGNKEVPILHFIKSAEEGEELNEELILKLVSPDLYSSDIHSGACQSSPGSVQSRKSKSSISTTIGLSRDRSSPSNRPKSNSDTFDNRILSDSVWTDCNIELWTRSTPQTVQSVSSVPSFSVAGEISGSDQAEMEREKSDSAESVRAHLAVVEAELDVTDAITAQANALEALHVHSEVLESGDASSSQCKEIAELKPTEVLCARWYAGTIDTSLWHSIALQLVREKLSEIELQARSNPNQQEETTGDSNESEIKVSLYLAGNACKRLPLDERDSNCSSILLNWMAKPPVPKNAEVTCTDIASSSASKEPNLQSGKKPCDLICRIGGHSSVIFYIASLVIFSGDDRFDPVRGTSCFVRYTLERERAEAERLAEVEVKGISDGVDSQLAAPIPEGYFRMLNVPIDCVCGKGSIPSGRIRLPDNTPCGVYVIEVADGVNPACLTTGDFLYQKPMLPSNVKDMMRLIRTISPSNELRINVVTTNP